MDKYNLPFKVGQLVEAKSFLNGYRGAWFRCKIKEIRRRKGDVRVAVEYYDFPDEKVRWTKLYQKFGRFKDLTLMIRPQFPFFDHKAKSSDIKSISEVVVVLNDVWKMGDLVDWCSDGCFWSGKLTEALGPEKFRIELFPPPAGEGLSYEACSKDMRPSLDWSPEHGWTVPLSEGHRSCARIIKPVNQGSSLNVAIYNWREDSDVSVSSDISTSQLPPSNKSYQMPKCPMRSSNCMETQAAESSCACVETQPAKRIPTCMETQPAESTLICRETKPVKSTTACMDTRPVKKNEDLHIADDVIGKTGCSDSISSLWLGGASAKDAGNAVGNLSHHDNGPSKKMRTDRSIMLNSMSSDTIEAAIVDLEELVNRVKWIKNILKFGMPLPDAVQPSWRFGEHRAPPMRK